MPKQPKSKLPRTGVFWAHPMPHDGWANLVAYEHSDGTSYPVLVLPMPSLKSARQRAKWENLTRKEKAERMAKAIADDSRNWKGAWERDCPSEAKESYRRNARAIIDLMEGQP